MKGPSKSKQQMDKLCAAAETLFRERGYYGVTWKDIAEAAGVRQSVVWRYWGSKEELYEELFPGREKGPNPRLKPKPKPERDSRPRSALESKKEIEKAARALFEKKGYSGVSIREITEAVGMSGGIVTYYFHTKWELYKTVFPDRAEVPPHPDKKEQIRQAALRLFAADGYEKVSIRDIGEAAGMGSAAISYYFGGKAKLYKEVLYRGTEMISEFEQMVTTEKPGPEQILQRYGQFLYELGQKKPEVLRLIFWELMHGSSVFSEFVQQRLSTVLRILCQAVEDGIRTGVFREDLSPHAVSISWSGMVLFYFLSQGVARDFAPEETMTGEWYVDQVWRIFAAGIRRGENGK